MRATKDEKIDALESDERMVPDASPGELNKSGVRRVNNMPLYLLGAAVGVFVLVMMIVAADKSAQQNKVPENANMPVAGNTAAMAKEIVGAQTTGMVAPAGAPALSNPATAQTASSSSAGATIDVVRPTNADMPPAPPGGELKPANGSLAVNAGGVRQDDLDRLRQSKLQMFEEAIKSKPTAQGFKQGAGSSPGISQTGGNSRDDVMDQLAAVRQQLAGTSGNDDPAAVYQSKLAQLKESINGGAGGGGTPPSLFNSANANGADKYSKFDKQAGTIDRWRLASEPQAPRTAYELRAGFVIPGLLISGINSDLPGQIMGQVSQNVYDTATGKFLLIPQGTRLVGQYSSEVAYGQNRVLVAWQRLVFPDGKAMDIGSMSGADSAGYSGYSDKVNNHFWKVFSSAFLMSGIVAGVSLSQSQDSGTATNNRQRANDAMSEALGQQLGQAMTQVIMKNLNVAPTIEIRPGYRFNVIVNKDLTFTKPYQSFDY